jgi:hypothetical protein
VGEPPKEIAARSQANLFAGGVDNPSNGSDDDVGLSGARGLDGAQALARDDVDAVDESLASLVPSVTQTP